MYSQLGQTAVSLVGTYNQVDKAVDDAFSPFGDPLVDLLVFLTALFGLYALGHVVLVPVVMRVVRARNERNPTLVTATETYLQVLVVLMAAFVGAVAAGYGPLILTTDSALIFAALTFTVGVAGREVIGSLISGLFLVSDPDFNVGDWISWPGGEGIVEAVDFRVTRVRTPDNATVTVPNTELTTNALARPFGRKSYRVTERVDIGYDGDVERALLELRQIAASFHRTGRLPGDDVLAVPDPDARVVELGSETVTVEVSCWLFHPTKRAIVELRSDLRREIKRRFEQQGLPLDPASGRDLSGSVTVTDRRAPVPDR